MPEICRFYGIVVRMYNREHNPPHFHASYAGKTAVVDVQTLEPIESTLPPRVERMLLRWARERQKELEENWNRAQDRIPLRRIDPLD